MKRAVTLLIATAALAAPASALGAPQLATPLPGVRSLQATGGTPSDVPINYASDHKALNAYAAYLTALLNVTADGRQNDTAFISSISDQCKSALAPLTQPSQQVDTTVQHTLMVLGEEMGSDLAISYDQAVQPAFERFSAQLSRLRWSRWSGGMFAVKRYISAESNVLSLAPSNLCLDASYAELKPDYVPDGTRAFMKSYTRASSLANDALGNLMRLLQAYEVPGEKSLVTRISNLAGELASQVRGDLLQSGTALSTVLESN